MFQHCIALTHQNACDNSSGPTTKKNLRKLARNNYSGSPISSLHKRACGVLASCAFLNRKMLVRTSPRAESTSGSLARIYSSDEHIHPLEYFEAEHEASIEPTREKTLCRTPTDVHDGIDSKWSPDAARILHSEQT